MLEKLAALQEKYDELTEEISKPEIIADQANWQKLMKAHADLEPVVSVYREYKSALDGIEEAKVILNEEKDAEQRE
jgi:peptide chain release factor 1